MWVPKRQKHSFSCSLFCWLHVFFWVKWIQHQIMICCSKFLWNPTRSIIKELTTCKPVNIPKQIPSLPNKTSNTKTNILHETKEFQHKFFSPKPSSLPGYEPIGLQFQRTICRSFSNAKTFEQPKGWGLWSARLKKNIYCIYIYMGVSLNGGFSPQIIRFNWVKSIIFTIHFGVPLFLETPIYHKLIWDISLQHFQKNEEKWSITRKHMKKHLLCLWRK